jgi:HlyD family secretion protein
MNKFRRLKITLIFAGVMMLGAGMNLRTKAAKSSEQPTVGVWQRVAPQSQSQELFSSGKLVPARMVEITTPAVGNLSALTATWGDSVKKDQELGRIDSPELTEQVRMEQAAQLRSDLQDGALLAGQQPVDVLNAKRRLLTAQTALKTAQTRQQESSTLYDKGFVSRNEDETARIEVHNAEEQVAQAQEEFNATARKYAPDQLQALKLEVANRKEKLALLLERQRRLTLKAPIDGVLLYPQTPDSPGGQPSRLLAVGSQVSAGASLMAIGDTSSFTILARCTEAEYAWLEAGADVKITLGALPEHSFSAKVSKVLGQSLSPTSDSSGEDAPFEFLVAFPAPVLPEAQRSKLRVGSTVKLAVSQPSSTPQTVIPLAAVQWASDGAAQLRWRAAATNAPEIKPIRILQAGVDEVIVREALDGEVWVPSTQKPKAPSILKRILGL